MSGKLLDTYPAGSTIYVLFDSFGSDGQSITLTGLLASDVEIYKNGSVTQRASDAGYALLDTDGIDFDGVTGIHGISIDLSDDTDAGFYAVGSQYTVVISAVTIDTQTVSFILGSFRIMAAEGVAGASSVNATHLGGTAQTGNDVGADVNAILVDTAEIGAAGAGLTALATQASVDTIDSNVDAILVDTGTTLDTKINTIDGIVDDILVDTAVIGAAGAGLTALATQASVDTIDGIVDAILVDTAVIGAAGAGLTALATQASVDTIDANVDAILVDTGTTLDGKIDTIDTNVDSILADTGTDGVVVAAASKTGYALSATGSAALTEGYAADGATATLPQLLYMIWAMLAEKEVASTTLTANKLDGTTAAMTFTLDDATTPTTITRAT
jgi:hypothetical protein